MVHSGFLNAYDSVKVGEAGRVGLLAFCVSVCVPGVVVCACVCVLCVRVIGVCV
jgi:hypothetical protein